LLNNIIYFRRAKSHADVCFMLCSKVNKNGKCNIFIKTVPAFDKNKTIQKLKAYQSHYIIRYILLFHWPTLCAYKLLYYYIITRGKSYLVESSWLSGRTRTPGP